MIARARVCVLLRFCRFKSFRITIFEEKLIYERKRSISFFVVYQFFSSSYRDIGSTNKTAGSLFLYEKFHI